MRPRRRFALRRLIARPTESEHPGAPINQPNTILKATKFAKTAIYKKIASALIIAVQTGGASTEKIKETR
jgi:hypothetical protein